MTQARLLVLDDDTLFRRVIKDHLEARGYLCHEAGPLAEAQALIQREVVDLALVDCWLPDGRGEQFCVLLRASQPDAMQVLVTADSAMRPHALDGSWPMDDFFIKSDNKPNSVGELLWRVEMHLAASARLQRLRLREQWLQRIAMLPAVFGQREPAVIRARLLPLLRRLPRVLEAELWLEGEAALPACGAGQVVELSLGAGGAVRLVLESAIDPDLIGALREILQAGMVGARIFSALQERQFSIAHSQLVRQRELSRMGRRLRRQGDIRDYFLMAMSHDLRSPLAVISGQSQLLEAKLLRPEATTRAYVNIRQQTERLSQEIERLVERYRRVAAQSEGVADGDLVQIAQVVQEVLGPGLWRRRQRSRLVTPAALPIRADLTALHETLHLLLGQLGQGCAEGAVLVLEMSRGEDGLILRAGPESGAPPAPRQIIEGLQQVVSELGGSVRPSPGGVELILPPIPLRAVRVLVFCADPARLDALLTELGARWPCVGFTGASPGLEWLRQAPQVMVLDHSVPGAMELLREIQTDLEREPLPVLYIAPPAEAVSALVAGATSVAELPLEPGRLVALTDQVIHLLAMEGSAKVLTGTAEPVVPGPPAPGLLRREDTGNMAGD